MVNIEEYFFKLLLAATGCNLINLICTMIIHQLYTPNALDDIVDAEMSWIVCVLQVDWSC